MVVIEVGAAATSAAGLGKAFWGAVIALGVVSLGGSEGLVVGSHGAVRRDLGVPEPRWAVNAGIPKQDWDQHIQEYVGDDRPDEDAPAALVRSRRAASGPAMSVVHHWATVPDAAATYFERATSAADQRYLSPSFQFPEAETQAWAKVLTDKLGELKDTGPNVDDHQGTPIGQGDTIGLVGAEVRMDQAALAALPPALRSGMLKLCGGDCAAWPAALRMSHTNAGMDLMRIALKVNTPDGVADLHFTETIKTFPMADAASLEAFIYSQEHGMGWTMAPMVGRPWEMLKMGINAAKMQHWRKSGPMDYIDESGEIHYDESLTNGEAVGKTGSVGKNFYSLTPFQVGEREDGGAVSAMKLRLRPQQVQEHPYVPKGGDARAAFREQFVSTVESESTGFDLMIQVATDPKKHPLNDASVVWDEEASPWVKVGEVTIPQQDFPAAKDGQPLTGAAALSEPFEGSFGSSKELLFSPAQGPHKPVGDISAFRAEYYPIYDRVRRKQLLGIDAPASDSKCPFSKIMKLFSR